MQKLKLLTLATALASFGANAGDSNTFSQQELLDIQNSLSNKDEVNVEVKKDQNVIESEDIPMENEIEPGDVSNENVDPKTPYDVYVEITKIPIDKTQKKPITKQEVQARNKSIDDLFQKELKKLNKQEQKND